MCGISGIFSKDKKDLSRKIIDGLKIINHRGPDETKYAVTNQFAAGTCRLSIEALKDGAQPVENSNFIAGFNGEIFNYKQLIDKFNLSKERCNSEIKTIIELYSKLGKDFVKNLNGQFAIYIYDKRNNKILLFRDHYGIRPLYYFKDQKNFAFSSEIKSIVSMLKSGFDLDLNSIYQTALFWTNIGSQTSVKKIKQLRPGHFIEFDFKNNFIEKKYFVDPLILNRKKKLNLTEDENNISSILEKSVKNQLQSQVGYACMLSGGVDSSILAYILNKNSSKQIDTFSIEFENKEYDESQFQKIISKHINSNHRSVIISEKDIADKFEKAIYHSESLMFRTAPIPNLIISELIKKSGHKVVFSGEGADEIALGYDIFFENRIRKFWSKNKNSKFRWMLLSKLYDYMPQFKNKRYLSLTKDYYLNFLDVKNENTYSHDMRWSQFDYVMSYFDFDTKKIKEESLKKFDDIYSEDLNNVQMDEKCQLIEINTLLSNYLLNIQGDRMTLANSVEGRYPYLDLNFTEYMSKINSNQKSPGVKSKYLLRKAFENKLPNEILNRSKIAYQAPEAKCFINNKLVSKQMEELLDNISNFKFIKKDNFFELIKKIQNPYSHDRLAFRENMVIIIVLSIYFLQKNLSVWEKNGKK